MTTVTDAELLAKIKSGLGITGEFQNETLSIYIDEVKEFMKSAGVKEAVVNSSKSVGCILKGVTDLWDLGSGNGKLSDYTKERIIQLTMEV